MKQGIKRILSLILLSSIAAGSFSCSSESPETTQPSDSGSPEVTEPADPVAGREAIDDELPDRNYENAVFTIATEADFDWTILQDEASGDVIDDAIYKRNLAVEERFNIELQLMADDFITISNKVTNIVQSGDNSLDLCMTHVVQTGNMALNGL